MAPGMQTAPGMQGMPADPNMLGMATAPGMPGMQAAPDMTGGLVASMPAAMDAQTVTAMQMGGMDPATYAAYIAQYQQALAMQQQVYLAQIAQLYAVPQLMPGQELPAGDEDGPEYLGQIVDYNEEKGWGFIECKETQLVYGKDIFLLRSSLMGNTVVTGDKVKFRVEKGEKGPKATSCDIVQKIADLAASMPTYYGKVKNFDEKRGMAFIECDETKSIYSKDILVLKTQLGDKPDGQVVSFNVVIDSRGIKAANVKVLPDGFPPGKEPKPQPKALPMPVNMIAGKGMNPNPMGFNPAMNQGKGMAGGKGDFFADPWQKGKGMAMWKGGGKGWAPY